MSAFADWDRLSTNTSDVFISFSRATASTSARLVTAQSPGVDIASAPCAAPWAN